VLYVSTVANEHEHCDERIGVLELGDPNVPLTWVIFVLAIDEADVVPVP
jgi:hypothetical protein